MKKLVLILTLVGMIVPTTPIFASAPAAAAIPTEITMRLTAAPFSWANFWGGLAQNSAPILLGAVASIAIIKYLQHKEKPSLTPTIPTTELKDIVGKRPQELEDLLDMINHPRSYRTIGCNFPRSLLFYGPPGTGKTQLARAIANKLEATYYEVCGSDLESKWVGQASKNITELFDAARKSTNASNAQKIQCVIFIDELESIAPKRTDSDSAAGQHANQTVGTLLAEMTKQTVNDHILVIGATNHKDMIDSALLRPGRFDSLIPLPLPERETTQKILEHYAYKYRLDNIITRNPESGKICVKTTINFASIADKIKNFSGAHIKELCTKAARKAGRARRTCIHQADFDSALRLMLPAKKQAPILGRIILRRGSV